MELFSAISETEQFEALCDTMASDGRCALFGAHRIHAALYAAALAKRLGRPVVFITETDAQAVAAAEDINSMWRGAGACAFPSRDFTLADVESTSHDDELARLAVLGRALAGNARVVCCSLEAYMSFTMPRELYESLSFTLETGGCVPLGELCARLVGCGYTRGDRVEGPGQFAVRGGIVDIFPSSGKNPVRLEMFGDEIDRMSEFSVETQRRTARVKTVTVTPAREIVPPADACERLQKLCERAPAELRRAALRDAELLRDGITPPATDRYMNLFYPAAGLLSDCFDDPVFFVYEPSALEKRAKNLLWQHSEQLSSLKAHGMYCKELGMWYEDDFSAVEHPATVLADAFTRAAPARLDRLITLGGNSMPRWSGEFNVLCEDLRGYLATGYRCLVLAGTERAASALVRDLEREGFDAVRSDDEVPQPGHVGVSVGSLSSGFEMTSPKLCVITGRRENKPLKKKRVRAVDGAGLTSLEDLREGDLVVHRSHGIGMYDGIHRIDHHGLVRDYIKIKYRGADTLYVPVTQLDMVSQYVSPGDAGAVKLAKLNSGEWQKTTGSVYRAVREMAGELIALYAKRETAEGIEFSQDTDWQREFEARFAYDETDDQLRASAEIKRDMQRPRPMDRLLCGDVGVGKTEVALRAVFKCVSDGYQCAVLVPTTILALQHYKTFLERMEAYPIKIAMLSRFTPAKDVKAAIKGIGDGSVDIAIGTHKLLQKDVKFKKLGLVVIDEEQRFGVAHKEKLKQAFEGVDVLTLSATPIPRTLNMAMSGIRDMSVIEEPPEDRHPVQTFVMEYDEGIVADAIKREMSRGGQVYYLHNRVETIESCAARISRLVPDARIEIAHGRMGEEQLSDVWRRLLEGEFDVLVCTTIIETGVDVPNCNTLIVENADRMGLAQLYQIRGRVGRSGRRAFAYFTFRRDREISEVAAKRLGAIRDFTSFGSGFKIAMRDLQIRGAGSVLSARQSGHMQAVGYDTYVRILKRAIEDEQGLPHAAEPVECTVDIGVSAFIPDSYIPDNESRIEMYKRIAGIQSSDDAEDVANELADRFGRPPECVNALVLISLTRALASRLGFYEVVAKGGDAVYLYSDRLGEVDTDSFIRSKTRRALVSLKGKSYLAVTVLKGENAAEAAADTVTLLRLKKDAPQGAGGEAAAHRPT